MRWAVSGEFIGASFPFLPPSVPPSLFYLDGVGQRKGGAPGATEDGPLVHSQMKTKLFDVVNQVPSAEGGREGRTV